MTVVFTKNRSYMIRVTCETSLLPLWAYFPLNRSDHIFVPTQKIRYKSVSWKLSVFWIADRRGDD